MGISEESNFKILHDDFGLHRESALWIPRLLSHEQKLCRWQNCKENLMVLTKVKTFFRIVFKDHN